MMSHAKQFVIPLLLLLLVACSSETAQQPPDAPAPTAQPEMESAQATNTAQPLPASPTAPPTDDAASADAASADATPADTAQSEPALATETPAPSMEASVTATVAAVAINGRSADGAYFLGREDAPLTIIDYSDFL